MANFEDHIKQATRNLKFLEHTNKTTSDHWDWQVTIGYYVGVHLVNGHLAKRANLHYSKHIEVLNAINCSNPLSPARFDEESYVSFKLLSILSRRSRYLIDDDDSRDRTSDSVAFYSSEKHFAKSIRHLQNVIRFIESSHSVVIPPIKIESHRLRTESFSHFEQ